jgi:hypothetical protein
VPKLFLLLTLGPKKFRFRKDFAGKEMTGVVPLNSGQGLQKLLFLNLAEDSFTLISDFGLGSKLNATNKKTKTFALLPSPNPN